MCLTTVTNNIFLLLRVDQNATVPTTEMPQQQVEEQPQRLTPAKFTTSHCTASLSHGLLVSVKPRYSSNGFNDVVKIFSMSKYFNILLALGII